MYIDGRTEGVDVGGGEGAILANSRVPWPSLLALPLDDWNSIKLA